MEKRRRLWSLAAYIVCAACMLAAVAVFILLPRLLPSWLLEATSFRWVNVGLRLLVQVGGFFASFIVLLSGWKWLFSRLLSQEDFQQVAQQLRADWSEDGV